MIQLGLSKPIPDVVDSLGVDGVVSVEVGSKVVEQLGWIVVVTVVVTGVGIIVVVRVVVEGVGLIVVVLVIVLVLVTVVGQADFAASVHEAVGSIKVLA